MDLWSKVCTYVDWHTVSNTHKCVDIHHHVVTLSRMVGRERLEAMNGETQWANNK